MLIQVAVSGETPRQVVLEKDEIVVGRSAEADVFLEGNQVSRVHCKLSHANGKWRISDCNSANGVYLDRGGRGAPFLARSDLVVSGDALYIGRFKLMLLMDADARALVGTASTPPAPRPAEDDGEDRPVVHGEKTVLVRRMTMKEDMRQWLMDDNQPVVPKSGSGRG